MPHKKTAEEKWRNKFNQEFLSCTLKYHQYLKLSANDQIKYLHLAVKKKYPNANNTNKEIAGKYSCAHCAAIDIFELNGYITDEEKD